MLTLRDGADEEFDLTADLLRDFKALNIPIDKSTIEEFMHIGDENNEEVSKEIIDDVNEMLEIMQCKKEQFR